MKDSTVWVYEGPRGSGKTLSAAFECAFRMLSIDETIISNVPINFDVWWNDHFEHFESRPLNINSLITLADEVRDATIFWDEMALWLYSRNSGAALNKLVTLVLTLMRKRKLCLIITTQSTRMLDSNVRMQMDRLITCFDASLRFPYKGPYKRERGDLIYQSWKDISGMRTGERYDDTGRVYPMYFHGKPFWGIYNTDLEFDVLEAQTKYKLNMGVNIISRDGVSQAFTPVPEEEVIEILKSLPDSRYNPEQIQEYLELNGLSIQPRVFGRYLKACGWIKHRGVEGYFYDKEEVRV